MLSMTRTKTISVMLKAAATLVIITSYAAILMAAFMDSPSSDEPCHVSPGVTLAHYGYPGNASLVGDHHFLPGIERATYYVLPGHWLMIALVASIFPAKLFIFRMASILCSIISLLILYRVLSRTLNQTETLIALSLLTLSPFWVEMAVTCRPEAPCIALGLSGVYLSVFVNSVNRSKLCEAFALMLIIASLLTHPNGLIFALTYLFELVSRSRLLKLSTWFLLCAIAAVAGGAYLAYGLAHAKWWHDQLNWNATALPRFQFFTQPLTTIAIQLRLWFYPFMGNRYIWSQALIYGFTNCVLTLGFLFYIAKSLPITLGNKVQRFMILITASTFITLTFVNSGQMGYYLVYRAIPLTIMLCLVAFTFISNDGEEVKDSPLRQLKRGLACLAMMTVATCSIGKDVAILSNSASRGEAYRQLEQFVSSHPAPGKGLVYGDWILEFMYDFAPQFKSDLHYGYFTHERADRIILVVKNVRGWTFHGLCSQNGISPEDRVFLGKSYVGMLETNKPGICSYVDNVLEHEYAPVYQNSGYLVLDRMTYLN